MTAEMYAHERGAYLGSTTSIFMPGTFCIISQFPCLFLTKM